MTASIGLSRLMILGHALPERHGRALVMERPRPAIALSGPERAQLFLAFDGDPAVWARIEAALADVFDAVAIVGRGPAMPANEQQRAARAGNPAVRGEGEANGVHISVAGDGCGPADASAQAGEGTRLRSSAFADAAADEPSFGGQV